MIVLAGVLLDNPASLETARRGLNMLINAGDCDVETEAVAMRLRLDIEAVQRKHGLVFRG